MQPGLAEKIILVDLTNNKVELLKTEEFAKWGGGHGIGSALFWKYCTNKKAKGFDPENVITLTAGGFGGTPVPSSGRTEVQGIGPLCWPVEWFTRSNFGGRFSNMLKFAGYQSIAVVGKAKKPVWIDIRDDKIEIRDASSSGDKLWGLDAHATQKAIYKIHGAKDDWRSLGDTRDAGRTTQRPAVVTTGIAGENMVRISGLTHDGGAGAAVGGFGAVFGSKNLKAISVIGTGYVPVADPNALLDTRIDVKNKYGYDPSDYKTFPAVTPNVFAGNPASESSFGLPARPEGCMSCHKSCHGARSTSGKANGSHCLDHTWYAYMVERPLTGKMTPEVSGRVGDLFQQYPLEVYEVSQGLFWIMNLLKKGLVGPGKLVDTDIFEKYKLGTYEFAEEYFKRIAEKREIGALLAEGLARAATKLGRFEEDTASGALFLQEWGSPHHYDGRTEANWGLASILGTRDVVAHDFNWICYYMPTLYKAYGIPMPLTAERMADIIGNKLAPYNDPMLIDYSDEGIYADSMVKLVTWYTGYNNYYKNSLGLCDWAYSDFINPNTPDLVGLTGIAEPAYVKSVFGKDQSFAEGIEEGMKIYQLDRAIWYLQGRTRDQEVYHEYMYKTPAPAEPTGWIMLSEPNTLPAYENGEWVYKTFAGRTIDREKLEDWKTRWYEFQGYDGKTGAPTRKSLEKAGLKEVADELEKAGVLGGAAK